MIHCCIFDLDGVIVNTAKYHYLAWKRLADSLGFDFTEHDNERLKGVSRVESLKIVLEIGETSLEERAFEKALEDKNLWYLDYISQIDAEEILPGAEGFLRAVRGRGIKVALGSASKNAPLILERIGLCDQFDAVIDGNSVSNAKPDPEVFLKAAVAVGCDAAAGVQAALNAGMICVGIGSPAILGDAHFVIPGYAGIHPDDLMDRIASAAGRIVPLPTC
jgi:beta-phosphoglucomutase